MKIEIKGLNPNETYACTVREAKEIFKGSGLKIRFGTMQLSRDERLNSAWIRPNKRVKGIIVASINAHKSVKDYRRMTWDSCIIFYIISKNSYPESLHQKFVQETLPKIKSFYELHKEDDPIANHGVANLMVGLEGDEFCYYETKKMRWIAN